MQVSSSKATVKIDTALLGTIEDALKAANIPYRGAELDPSASRSASPTPTRS